MLPQVFFKVLGQLSFTSPIMGQRQKVDRHSACCLLVGLFQKRCEHVAEYLPGKELVAIDQSHQRHGLFAQRMDHMVIIDHVTMAAIPEGASPFACHQRSTAQKHLQPIIVEPDPQAMSNQP